MHILSVCISFVGSLQPYSHCNHCNTQTAALLGNVQELRLHERLSRNRNLVQFWGHCVKHGCIYLVLELMEVIHLQRSPSYSLPPSVSCRRKLLSPQLREVPASCMPALAQMRSSPSTSFSHIANTYKHDLYPATASSDAAYMPGGECQ